MTNGGDLVKPEIHAYDRDTIEHLRATGVGEPLLARVQVMAQAIAYKNHALAEAEARIAKLEVLFAGKSGDLS